LRRRRYLQLLENPADAGGADLVAELEQLALDPLVSQAGFSVASRPTRTRTAALTGRRPVRFGYVHFQATSRLCHRRTVPGVTSRCARRVLGRCPISAARTARSAQSIRGPGWVRRSTATSWRRMRISASLDAEDRPSKMSHPASRRKIRYSMRIDTADHHARGPGCSRIPRSQPLADFLTPHRRRPRERR